MKRALITLLALAAPTVAFAEEPTGFAEFPWGTPRTDLWQPCTTPARTMPQVLPSQKPMTLPSYPPAVFAREGGVSEMTCGGAHTRAA